jgi:hypothetical protein
MYQFFQSLRNIWLPFCSSWHAVNRWTSKSLFSHNLFLSDFNESQIFFFIQTFHDHQLLALCLQELRKRFPKARVLVVSDGDLSPQPRLIAKSFEAEFLLGTNCAKLQAGGTFLRRMLGLFLQRADAKVLIRIDPDTRLHREFRRLPAGICVFGTLQRAGFQLSIQGGFVGFTREAAERIFRLPPATWALMRQPTLSWAKFLPKIQRESIATSRVKTDWLIAFAAREACVPLREFSEVRCHWKAPPQHPARYAATHPHKERNTNLSISG